MLLLSEARLGFHEVFIITWMIQIPITSVYPCARILQFYFATENLRMISFSAQMYPPLAVCVLFDVKCQDDMLVKCSSIYSFEIWLWTISKSFGAYNIDLNSYSAFESSIKQGFCLLNYFCWFLGIPQDLDRGSEDDRRSEVGSKLQEDRMVRVTSMGHWVQ